MQGVSLLDVFRDSPEMLGQTAEAKASLLTFEDKELEQQAVMQLHTDLRAYCDLMGVGLGMPTGDTVSENASAGSKESSE